jgi:hypothetical protein
LFPQLVTKKIRFITSKPSGLKLRLTEGSLYFIFMDYLDLNYKKFLHFKRQLFVGLYIAVVVSVGTEYW